MRLLARREVELTRRGERFLNQALFQDFQGRTLESIKARRRIASYKQLVNNLMEEIEEQAPSVDNAEEEQEVLGDFRQAISEYLLSLPELTGNDFRATELQNICNRLNDAGNVQDVIDRLTLYLRAVFPVRAQRRGIPDRDRRETVQSKRQVRRAEYARVQDLWKKNRSKCIRMLLDDVVNVRTPPKEDMVAYWERVMQGGTNVSPGSDTKQPTIVALWAPIAAIEIRKAFPANTTSAGPDGLTARALRKVPLEILVRVFNIIMWCGKAPTHLLESITSLIPKKSNAHQPGDFRPITVSSVLIRAFHKILATRMAAEIRLDQRQRAFRPTDGCSDNVFLLDLILKHHHRKHKSLFVASLDVAKAFDSVSHTAIRETLAEMGLPQEMVRYIMNIYAESTTRLCCGSWTSDTIKPTCGVKQGDPMSPIIFNMVFDRMLRKLPTDVGAKVGDLEINAAAFADDLLLFASTPMGLQRLLDTSMGFLEKCGLQVNTTKCMTIALRNVPHEKKTVVDRSAVFLRGDNILPSLKRSDEWQYLGVPFTPEGRAKVNVTQGLRVSLEKLTKAPLKPQQRLYILRTVIQPGLYHKLELGDVCLSIMRKCDKMMRAEIRRWLNLPADTPNAYFHATIRDGGLGISSLRWNVPLRRLGRLRKLPLAEEGAAQAPGAFLQKEIAKCEDRLRDQDQIITSQAGINVRWAQLLYNKVDGMGLRGSAEVPQQHTWIGEGTRFLTGRDYLQSCKLRINALPTKSRVARGRPKERNCRAGCGAAETLNHILQRCHRTHGTRVRRHDAVVSYLNKICTNRGHETEMEPRFQTEAGLRKPDLVVKLGVTAVVVDAQVVNDQVNLDYAHTAKQDYYKNLERAVKTKYGVESVVFTSATLSWRGLWSRKSAGSLVELGILRKGQLKVLSSRVIIGGLACFHLFNKATGVRPRTGVG